MTRILVIDDEPQIRRALRIGLERSGCTVSLASGGEEGLAAAEEQPPHLVILDLELPDIGGLEVCRRLREWSDVPIIFLSVRETDRDKVEALNAGADDYLTKPFSMDELVARVRALLRRVGAVDREVPVIAAGDLLIDFDRRRVTVGGREVHLTPTEYTLLGFMARHPDRVLTHTQLLARAWGPEHVEDTHSLRVHIAHLREKIEADPAHPRYIHTETRVGYRFRHLPSDRPQDADQR